MKRLLALGLLVQVAACDMVVGIDDVVLASGGAGGSGTADVAGPGTGASSSTDAQVNGSAATDASTGAGNLAALCETLPGDAFDALLSSRWTIEGGVVESRSAALAMKLDASVTLASVASRSTMADRMPCAAWVTVKDRTKGVEQGIGVLLDDGTVAAIFRNGDVVGTAQGGSAGVSDKDVVLRMRFEASPGRVVYEIQEVGSVEVSAFDSIDTDARPAAPVRLYTRRVTATGTVTAHFDDFDR